MQELPGDVKEKFNADLAWHHARYTHIEAQDIASHFCPNTDPSFGYRKKGIHRLRLACQISWRCIDVVEPETGFLGTSERAKRGIGTYRTVQSLTVEHEGGKKNDERKIKERKVGQTRTFEFFQDSRMSHRTGALYAKVGRNLHPAQIWRCYSKASSDEVERRK